jgi:hypothetical protein
VGAVQFVNFKVANNVVANMEVNKVIELVDGYAKIKGGWSLGKSPWWRSDKLTKGAPIGIIFPRSENFMAEDTKFCYYYWDRDASALGTCSQCHNDYDRGAYQTTIENLWYHPTTVTSRIRWDEWNTAIILDLDSSTTEHPDAPSSSWATPNLLHNRHGPSPVEAR